MESMAIAEKPIDQLLPSIKTFCDDRVKVSTTEILHYLKPQTGKHDGEAYKFIVDALRELGYEKNGKRHKALINKKRQRVWTWELVF